MYAHTDKTQEHKSYVLENDISSQQRSEELTSHFIDNRPEAVVQGKLQEMASSSPQSMRTAQLQSMVDSYSAQQQHVLQQNENTTGLPDSLKAGIESLSSYSMDDVHVHYHSDKPAQLQALAYAQGTDIHVSSGQEQHLPHEAWHVVQQKQGRVRPTMQLKGKVMVNDDAGLEEEADRMGRKASQLKAPYESTSVYATVSSTSIQRQVIQRYQPQNSERGLYFQVPNHFGNYTVGQYTGDSSSGYNFDLREGGSITIPFYNHEAIRPTWGMMSPMKYEPPSYDEEDFGSFSDDPEQDWGSVHSGIEDELDPFHSDEEDAFPGINTFRREGRKKVDLFMHVSMDAIDTEDQETSELEDDAKAIHRAGGGDSRLTIVCVQFKTRTGYLHVAVSNSRSMPPAARREAERRGYVILQGIKTHGESNMVLYARKHYNDLRYDGHGCDKGACRQCEELLEEEYEDVDYGGQGTTGKYSGTYYSSEMETMNQERVGSMRRQIDFNYSSSGSRFLSTSEQRAQDLLRQQVLANRMNVNNCLINAIARAAGVAVTNAQLLRIRLRLYGQGVAIGAMLVANDNTVDIITEELNLDRDVTVHYPITTDIPNETLGNNLDIDPIDVYHTGELHFQAQQPRGVNYY